MLYLTQTRRFIAASFICVNFPDVSNIDHMSRTGHVRIRPITAPSTAVIGD
jgi:hypothetical protein